MSGADGMMTRVVFRWDHAEVLLQTLVRRRSRAVSGQSATMPPERGKAGNRSEAVPKLRYLSVCTKNEAFEPSVSHGLRHEAEQADRRHAVPRAGLRGRSGLEPRREQARRDSFGKL